MSDATNEMCRNALEYQGGQGVLTARSLIQSEQFDEGWDVLSKTYIEKITLPENVIPFRKLVSRKLREVTVLYAPSI